MEQGIRDWDSIGTLRIGTSITAGTCFLPEVAKKFYALRPQIQLQVSIENSRTLEERVLSNQVDFAIIEGLCHSDKLCLLYTSHPRAAGDQHGDLCGI